MIPASAKYTDVKDEYKVNENMLEYLVTVQTSEDIAQVYSLTKSQAEKIIKENSVDESGEPTPSNPAKREINDIRNQFEQESNDSDKDDKSNN